MVDIICRHIKNYFIAEVHKGSFSVTDGCITEADFLSDGDYILISGSRYNDGVHIYLYDWLKDEDFDGEIAVMNPPDEFLELCGEIEEYCTSDVSAASPYKKESFGGYSYERYDSDSGVSSSWQSVFKYKLNPWRKIL